MNQDFSHDYDLDSLELITPQLRDFQLWTTPRHKHLFINESLEMLTANLINSYAKSAELFVDVGAHYGYFSILVGKSNPDCQIIAYEPILENCEVLRKNLVENNVNHIQVINRAVSNFNGEERFYKTEASEKSALIQHPDSKSIVDLEVQVEKLDTVIQENSGKSILVKIDTNGNELEVIDGMREHITEKNDITLIVAYNPACLLSAGNHPNKLLDLLFSLDFDIYLIDDDKACYYPVHEEKIYGGELIDIDSVRNLVCVKKKKSLNLAIFAHSSHLAGAERSLLYMIEGLIQKYHSLITVYLPNQGPINDKLFMAGAVAVVGGYTWWSSSEPVDEGEMDKMQAASFSWLVSELENLNRLDPDIVITNTLVIPWGSIAALLLELPHVWLIQETGGDQKFHYPYDSIIQYIVDSSKKIVVNSKAVRKLLFQDNQSDQIELVYYNFDLPDPDCTREEINYFKHEDSLRLLILGMVRESKGQLDAVLAVIELIRNRDLNVELLIVGHSKEKYLNIIKQLVIDAELQDYIRFLPFQNNVFPIIEQSDILLMCSKFEAFGRVTVEGMLMEKAVIGTRAGGTVEIINDGVTGLLYSPGDINQLADHIEGLIQNPAFRDTLAKNAYAYALTEFTKNNYIEKYFNIFVQEKRVDNLPYGVIQNSITRLLGSEILKVLEIEKSLRSKLADYQDRTAFYSTENQTLEQKIQDLNRRLTERKREVKTLQDRIDLIGKELKNKEISFLQVNSNLLEIYESSAWRIVRIIWRIRLILAPKGSLREKAGQSIIRKIKNLRKLD